MTIVLLKTLADVLENITIKLVFCVGARATGRVIFDWKKALKCIKNIITQDNISWRIIRQDGVQSLPLN